MKRIDLIRAIEAGGGEFIRHGAKHDWYRNPTTGVAQPVPRHREIKEGLARRIIRLLSNPSRDPGEGDDESDPSNDGQEDESSS